MVLEKMNSFVIHNRGFLTDLFGGASHRHAIITCPEPIKSSDGDFLVSKKPVKNWLSWAVTNYESKVKILELFQDDSVPYVNLNTNTGVFASAFGCCLHVYKEDTAACAMPMVETAEEADRLPEPDLNAPAIERFFELANFLRYELGKEVPISVPDVQSPFDIAALVWKKENMMTALYERPDSVLRLVEKCLQLLKIFLRTFIREFPNCNLCHCPTAWAPPEFGVWLSEDEAGSISSEMFVKFCLPSLVALSREFGGMFIHCCANADHQYGNFRRIPNLRGLNRYLPKQSGGPRAVIEAFSEKTVIMPPFENEQKVYEWLDMALPNTRFLFNLPVDLLNIEEAKRMYDRIRVAVTKN
ncbi:MAG: uroporphyrinogen decarboxylase family protein [Candidatus Omnitrophota bacterium]